MANIVAIVGLCGTGKSEITRYFEEGKGYTRVYFGGFVVGETEKRGLSVIPENEKIVREDLRNKLGPAAIAHLALPEISTAHTDGIPVIIDGMYSFSEYKFLKAKFSHDLVVIAVHATKEIRYTRLQTRKVRPLTREQVDARDYAEIENIEKGGPIAIADFHILNDGSLQDLFTKIDSIYSSLQ